MDKIKLPKAAANEKNSAQTGKEAKLVQLLLKNGLVLQREMNQVCLRFGLKQQQFSVLDAIMSRGPVPQKAVRDALFYEKSNISKIVKILLEKGLIQVTTAPEDRRLTLLIETEKGAVLWKQCAAAFAEASADLVASLSREEVAGLVESQKVLEKTIGKRLARQEASAS